MVGRQRQRAVVAASLAALGASIIGGCGVSPRDEYMRIRGITVEPQAGDGSTVASLNFTVPTALGATDDSLAMTTDMPR
ncbi:MAG: hypothetical protein IT436_09310 [Phycisphaerales bacterium]|nr:hypothetical protein [Phycisphaerales bacterium]